MINITVSRDGERIRISKHEEAHIEEWRDIFWAILVWLTYPPVLIEEYLGEDKDD